MIIIDRRFSPLIGQVESAIAKYNASYSKLLASNNADVKAILVAMSFSELQTIIKFALEFSWLSIADETNGVQYSTIGRQLIQQLDFLKILLQDISDEV
ncbi:unnamed protein product, partial [marine sediment metagenome]